WNSGSGLAARSLAMPLIVEHFEQATFDVRPVTRFVAAAADAARAHGHARVLVEHALLALLNEPTFADAVHMVGCDVDRVRERLHRLLHPRFVSALLGDAASVTTAAIQHANAHGPAHLSIRPIVVELLRQVHSAVTLESIAVPRFELLFAFVHRRPWET